MNGCKDRRENARMLCAELVEVRWDDSLGSRHYRVANLEDISAKGLCLQIEMPVLIGTHLAIRIQARWVTGIAVYSYFRDGATFVGVKADENSLEDLQLLEPEHILDPREMVDLVLRRRGEADMPHANPRETQYNP